LTKHELSTDLHVVNPSAKDSLLAAAQTVSDAVTSALPTAVTGSESKPRDKGLRFQALFHTYLAVSDSSTVKAQGLRSGLNYVDKMKGGSKEVWEGGDLKFDQAVDR
jgi:D-hexose-6-phosphate mutarotase